MVIFITCPWLIKCSSEIALSVYLRAEFHSNTVNCFVQRGKYDKIVTYASSVGLKMDYSSSRMSETSSLMKNYMVPLRFYL